MVKRTFFILLLTIFIFSRLIIAQQINVKASVDSANYSVGDYINYTITVNYGKEIRVYWPILKDSLHNIDIVKNGQVSTKEGGSGNVGIIKYVLSKYDSGDVKIPQLPVYYTYGNDTAKKYVLTNPVSFTVHTLKVDKNAEIKDVKEPIKIPLDWKIILIWVIGILIIAGLLFWGILYYRKKQAAKKGIIRIIERKPHEIALDALRELEAKELWQKGNIKQYHTELTEIIRRYFENRFFIPALEMTTSDLLQRLRMVKGADGIINTTSGFLNNADMVKFAKFVPMDMVNQEMMQQAYDIVNSTIQKIELEENSGRTGNVQ